MVLSSFKAYISKCYLSTAGLLIDSIWNLCVFVQYIFKAFRACESLWIQHFYLSSTHVANDEWKPNSFSKYDFKFVFISTQIQFQPEFN